MISEVVVIPYVVYDPTFTIVSSVISIISSSSLTYILTKIYNENIKAKQE